MNDIMKSSGQPPMVVTPGKASLVEIRTNGKAFPRLYTYRREEAVAQMSIILLMAYQYRGQQADAVTISQMSNSLVDILLDDEYNIGTKFISFEEIKRVVRKAALGQSKEIYGVSVSSIFQAIADYCRGEGRVADKQAKEIVARQREMRNAIIAPMIQGHIEELIKK